MMCGKKLSGLTTPPLDKKSKQGRTENIFVCKSPAERKEDSTGKKTGRKTELYQKGGRILLVPGKKAERWGPQKQIGEIFPATSSRKEKDSSSGSGGEKPYDEGVSPVERLISNRVKGKYKEKGKGIFVKVLHLAELVISYRPKRRKSQSFMLKEGGPKEPNALKKYPLGRGEEL